MRRQPRHLQTDNVFEEEPQHDQYSCLKQDVFETDELRQRVTPTAGLVFYAGSKTKAIRITGFEVSIRSALAINDNLQIQVYASNETYNEDAFLDESRFEKLLDTQLVLHPDDSDRAIIPAHAWTPYFLARLRRVTLYFRTASPILDYSIRALTKAKEQAIANNRMSVFAGSTIPNELSLSGNLDAFPTHLDRTLAPIFSGKIHMEYERDSCSEGKPRTVKTTLELIHVVNRTLAAPDYSLIEERVNHQVDILLAGTGDTGALKPLAVDYDLQMPDTSEAFFRQWEGKCIDSTWDVCKSLVVKLVFKHLETLSAGQVKTELFKHANTLSETITSHLQNTTGYHYLGYETVQGNFALTLNGVPASQNMDDGQVGFLQEQVRDFLNTEFPPILAETFDVELDTQIFVNRQRRQLRSDDAINHRSLDNNDGSIQISGVVTGGQIAVLGSTDWAERIDAAFAEKGDAFSRLLRYNMHLPGPMSQNERYKYFEDLSGASSVTQGIANPVTNSPPEGGVPPEFRTNSTTNSNDDDGGGKVTIGGVEIEGHVLGIVGAVVGVALLVGVCIALCFLPRLRAKIQKSMSKQDKPKPVPPKRGPGEGREVFPDEIVVGARGRMDRPSSPQFTRSTADTSQDFSFMDLSPQGPKKSVVQPIPHRAPTSSHKQPLNNVRVNPAQSFQRAPPQQGPNHGPPAGAPRFSQRRGSTDHAREPPLRRNSLARQPPNQSFVVASPRQVPARRTGPALPGAKFHEGQQVFYKTEPGPARILKVHLDDGPEAFYTIALFDGREKQTTESHLHQRAQTNTSGPHVLPPPPLRSPTKATVPLEAQVVNNSIPSHSPARRGPLNANIRLHEAAPPPPPLSPPRTVAVETESKKPAGFQPVESNRRGSLVAAYGWQRGPASSVDAAAPTAPCERPRQGAAVSAGEPILTQSRRQGSMASMSSPGQNRKGSISSVTGFRPPMPRQGSITSNQAGQDRNDSLYRESSRRSLFSFLSFNEEPAQEATQEKPARQGSLLAAFGWTRQPTTLKDDNDPPIPQEVPLSPYAMRRESASFTIGEEPLSPTNPRGQSQPRLSSRQAPPESPVAIPMSRRASASYSMAGPAPLLGQSRQGSRGSIGYRPTSPSQRRPPSPMKRSGSTGNGRRGSIYNALQPRQGQGKPRFSREELERMSIEEVRDLLPSGDFHYTESKKDLIDRLIDSGAIDLIVCYKMSTLQRKSAAQLKRCINDAGVKFDTRYVVEKQDMIRVFAASGKLRLLPEQGGNIDVPGPPPSPRRQQKPQGLPGRPQGSTTGPPSPGAQAGRRGSIFNALRPNTTSGKPLLAREDLQQMSTEQLRGLLPPEDKFQPTDRTDLVDHLINSGAVDLVVSFTMSSLQNMSAVRLKRCINQAGVSFDTRYVVEKQDMIRVFKASGKLRVIPEPLEDVIV